MHLVHDSFYKGPMTKNIEIDSGLIWVAPQVYAAIGSDGARAVVWGLGWSAQAAHADADQYDPGWGDQGSCTVEISEQLADRVRAGEVDCASLGITVSVRDGQIVG